ncbi:MAG: hypothetical protein ACAI38_12330 [Myxococcota bacterium]
MNDKKEWAAEALAAEMQVTFDTDELASFFDGFESLEEIAKSLCAPLGGGREES